MTGFLFILYPVQRQSAKFALYAVVYCLHPGRTENSHFFPVDFSAQQGYNKVKNICLICGENGTHYTSQ